MMLPIYHHDSLDSTNLEAKRLAESGAVHGTSVIAKTQTGGRGRLGKKWHTVPGKGLYCSIIIRPNLAAEDYPKLTLVAGLAIGLALKGFVGRMAQLKWPNDIYYNGKKCAGILAESSPFNLDPDSRYGVVGIGININQTLCDFPQELQEIVTTLSLETGKQFDIDTVFTAVRDQLLHQVLRMEIKGFSHILSEWRESDYLAGSEIECVDNKGEIVRGVAQGPDESGILRLKTKSGEFVEVLSGDISLAHR